ncbi:hypothetical protein [Clostridium estertheticum]|uniref:hypothetical protein n=1 Tax=Clostridium estertheticum TaxID=238834 RepID=UPI001C7CD747|nr:hypothetical protein [Clostridium estertheticum]MBX4266141.1 hypothetical protein [Clostridium estertheticum]WLC87947.1 hypothetical protein KTC95_18230 [Clostridium estertheticum]
MIKRSSLRTLFCGLAVSVLMGGTAMAYGIGYSDYYIKPLNGNSTTNVHDKVTNLKLITNSVTAISSYDRNRPISYVDFWAEDANGNDLSNSYSQNGGNTTNIMFKNGVKKGIGDQVQMTLQNHSMTDIDGRVTGSVNFR